MKLNSNGNKRCQLYAKQEKQVNKYYADKKKSFKNYIEEKASEFKNKTSNFKTFNNIITQYCESIQKNKENLDKILSNLFQNTQSSDPYLVILDQVLTNQYESESEKLEQLNISLKSKKMNPDYEKKGKDALNLINRQYHEYANLIDKLNSNHISYLRQFNDFEIKMIKDETKETKETEAENLEHFNPKEDTLLISLHNKENLYKTNLENVNKELKVINDEVNKSVEELNNINKEINDIMGSNLTNIYIGFITTSKMQKVYEKKILSLNQFNPDENIDNKTDKNKSNIDTTKEEKDKLELERICQSMQFSSYNLLSPYANISGYKQQNKILEKLKPEIIYKISCIINSEFNYIPKADLKDQYTIMDVKLISQRILESTAINNKEEEQLYRYLEERKYMLAFLAELNNIRSAGKFQLKKKNIMILGKAYKIIIDKLCKETNIDFDILRYLIIMSQTYYALGINGKDKIYLIRFIEDSPYFKSEKLWNIYISEVIDRELEAKDSANIWYLESQESEEFNVKQTYFGNLIGLAQNMMEFHLGKDLVTSIIHNLINTKYNMSEELIQQIDSLIENTNYDINTKLDPDKDILE